MAPSRSPVPRGLWPLLVLALAVLAWAFFGEKPRPAGEGAPAPAADADGRARKAPAAPAAGGEGEPAAEAASAGAQAPPTGAEGPAILPLPPADVTRLAVTGPAGQTVLSRPEGGAWRLEKPWFDDLDQEQVGLLLERLAAAPLVETPEVPDPTPAQLAEYGLSGADAWRLEATDRTGRTATLAFGRRNPVLDRTYARLPGRRAVYTAAAGDLDLLTALPHNVRLRQMWPDFDLSDIDTVALRPAGAAAADLLALDARGHWWLRQPADGAARLGPVAVAYAGLYRDRTRVEGGATWWRASDRAVRDLLFGLRDTRVKRFLAAAAPPESLAAAGIGPRDLMVRAVDAAAPLREWRVDVGRRLPRGEWLAARHGHLLRVDNPGPTAAQRPLADLVETTALPFPMADVDSLRLERPDGAGVTGRQHDHEWSVDLPQLPLSDSPPGLLFSHMALRLERLGIGRPLPSVKGHDPLAEPYRVYLTAWLRDGATVDLDLGLPVGAADEAALWSSADGRLVTVDRQILVDLKTLFLSLGLSKS